MRSDHPTQPVVKEALETCRNLITNNSSRCKQKFMSGEIQQAFGPGSEIGDISTMYHANIMNILRLEASEKTLRQIDRALKRLDLGQYGLCESCREPIDEQRLRLIPYAALCLDCQEEIDERKRRQSS